VTAMLGIEDEPLATDREIVGTEVGRSLQDAGVKSVEPSAIG